MMLKVRARRLELGLSLDDLSKSANLTVEYLKRLEAGRINPHHTVRFRLAKALQAQKEALFTDIDLAHDYLMNKVAGK